MLPAQRRLCTRPGIPSRILSCTSTKARKDVMPANRRIQTSRPFPTAISARLHQITAAASVAAIPVATQKAIFLNFDDMIETSPIPVLVDFYATWCGPCQLMSGILTDIAPTFKDVKIVKIDIDKYPQIATKYRVQGLPTLLLFREGKPIDRVQGLLDSKSLGRRLRFQLAGLESKFGRR